MNIDSARRLPIPLALGLVAASTLAAAELFAAREDYLLFLVRETAYISSTFFLVAYYARPLQQLTGAAWASALVLLRRRVGVAAALVHTIHFFFVVAFVRYTGRAVGVTTLVGGGLGFVMYWLLALTSNDAAVRALGANWKRLHRVGIHYIWFIYLQTYAGAVGELPVLGVFIALLVVGLALRIHLYVGVRRRSA